LPVGDGLLEIGRRVPMDRLESAIQDWFERKGYVKTGMRVRVSE